MKLARKPPGNGWIGVDLDGTIAHYTKWKGPTEIGAPIPKMVERVKDLLRAGYDVRIFTARVSEPVFAKQREVIVAIEAWCLKHVGQVLPVTNVKDYDMLELYDDRAIQVIGNTGVLIQEVLYSLFAKLQFAIGNLEESTK